MDYNALIDDYLKREPRAKIVGKYYPSEIGSCLRRTYYSYVSPKAVDPAVVRVFEAGNILHDFVVRVFESEKTPQVELLQKEMKVSVQDEDLLISGRVDDLLLVKDSGKMTLVEVKSTASLKYVERPQASHLLQLQFYLHSTGVHNGVLLYIEKNTLQVKSFELPYDPRIASDALARFRLLHHCLLDRQVPMPESKEKPEQRWLCRNCDWRRECDAQEMQDTGKITPV